MPPKSGAGTIDWTLNIFLMRHCLINKFYFTSWWQIYICTDAFKVIYHLLYGTNGVIGYHVTLSEGHMIVITPYKETLVPHLVATLIYLSQIYSYYIRGDGSPLTWGYACINASLYHVKLSIENDHPHKWLPVYKNTVFSMFSNSDANLCNARASNTA